MKLKFKPSSLIKIQIFVLIAFLGFFIKYAFDLKKQTTLTKKEIAGYRSFFEDYKRNIEIPRNPVILPEKLQNIPFADLENIVLRTKKVTIRNVSAPHSPSLIKQDNGYLMFFQYYKIDSFSQIGCVQLDKNFDQTDQEFVTVETSNKNSADPRAFQIGKEIYLTYTKSDEYATTMNIASIDPDECKIKFTTELDLGLRSTEKNWVPFEYISEKGKPEIFFQYNFNPHKIVHLPNPKENYLIHPIFSKEATVCFTDWDKRSNGWGPIEGGSPALKIGNKYLAFFYNSFSDREGNICSAMGAYTFEASPPFQIKALSLYPILFSGIYDSGHPNTPNKKTIIPTGFVMEEEKDQKLIHLCCEENSCAIKIITFNRRTLLQHMKKLGQT